jgi:CheY-like chemotaxis protein
MKKVLIVDDQSFIRTVLSRALQDMPDVEIIEATNGNEAVGKAKFSRPDLILLDIVMPNKDGRQVIDELAADPSTKDIPIIVVSSHAEDTSIQEVLDAGAKEFINKMDLNNIDFVGLVKKYLYAGGAAAQGQTKKILIVDDQSFIRSVLKKEMEQLVGVEIFEAENGNEALGKAKVIKPDLILLDIVMPNKDGKGVLREIAADPTTYDIPVVVISSHADDQTVAEVKELGAKEFVNKMELNNYDFLGMIHRYIG